MESVYTPEKYTYTVNNLGEDPSSTKQKGGIHGSSAAPQPESDEEAPESPKEKAGTEEESEDVEMPRSGREGRTSFEIPSTSGQEKRAKSDFLNLLSFKMKGPKPVTGGKGYLSSGIDAPVKNLNLSRNSPKILQSRLTSFVSTSKKSNATER